MNCFVKKKKYIFIDLLIIPIKLNCLLMIFKITDVIIYALLPIFQALLTANVIDLSISYLSGNNSKNKLIINFIALVLCIAGEYLNDLAMTYIDGKNEKMLLAQYQKATIDKRSLLKYQFIENERIRDLISRVCTSVEDNRFIKGFNNLMIIIKMTITITSLLIIVSQKVWWLGLSIIIISIPLFILSLVIGKETYEENKTADVHRREADYLQHLLRNRENVEERSLFSYSEYINKIWYEKYEIVRKILLKTEIKYWIKIKLSGIITAVILLLILIILLYPLYLGNISIGLFMSLTIAFVEVINEISWSLIDIMKELASSNSYLKDLNVFFGLEQVSNAKKEGSNQRAFKKIIFADVSFKYPFSDEYILKHFSMQFESGMHYAIVGKNGVGKTTITKLLLGLYNDYEGNIYIDDIELRNISIEDLSKIFAVVFQDFARYEISLKENITVGERLQYKEEQLKNSIASLNITEIIEKLPQGEDTLLGRLYDSSVDLSGGEWQRIAIARAMYNDAPVRILDEPSAALDPISESNIYRLFKEVSTDKTMIMITHRLGATQIADCIIVVEDGGVKEHGTHKDLMNKNGIYAAMYRTQKGWYENG